MPKVCLTVHEKELEEIESALAGAIGERHLKQKDVAKRLGKSQPSVSNMIRNIENMKVGDLLRICELTNRKIEILKRGEQ